MGDERRAVENPIFIFFKDFKSFNTFFQHILGAGEIIPGMSGGGRHLQCPLCPSVRRDGTAGADTGRAARSEFPWPELTCVPPKVCCSNGRVELYRPQLRTVSSGVSIYRPFSCGLCPVLGKESWNRAGSAPRGCSVASAGVPATVPRPTACWGVPSIGLMPPTLEPGSSPWLALGN